jgi:hypothetical protein
MLSRAIARCLSSLSASAGVASTLRTTVVAPVSTVDTIDASNMRAAANHHRVRKANPNGEFAVWNVDDLCPVPPQRN